MTPELDPERRLALAYVPAARRPALAALWRLDLALGAVLASGRDPMVSRIRLAWWRESLEKLDLAPAPAEPVLAAVAHHHQPAGLSGAELAAMEEGWAALLAPEVAPDDLDTYARQRGGLLFGFAARLLGGDPEAVAADGEGWALIDFARRSSSPDEAATALQAAHERSGRESWPKPLRPLGMIGVLARRDAGRGPGLERQGSPARVARMLRLRLTGR
ncbi:MAG: squalene/phytoene synthase family protein [Allosphingosinicella sp.]